MKRLLVLLLCLVMTMSMFAGCSEPDVPETTGQNQETTTSPTETTLPQTTPPTTEATIPTYETIPLVEGSVYYVGPTREHKSLTKLFLELKDDHSQKTIYVDEGVYDIFREYREAGIATPPDDVTSPDYFDYNAFLPINTNLIGVGKVRLEFAPKANEITYGESRTWSPLNILGACRIENIEIYCKNGRYAIHDDSHNDYQNTLHYYKNVTAIYEYSDRSLKTGQRLGFNNTIGNGMAQGSTFLFEDCTFQFIGGENNSAFYTHESGSKNPENAPTLTFRNCKFLSHKRNIKAIRLQNLATADLHIITTFENCEIEGGIYLTIYKDTSAQHFDVTVINSGNPLQLIDKPEQNRYPIKVK